MTWLNAVLSFTLSMIVFCTMVSALTEIVHRLFHMRPKGLQRMLGELFDAALWPQCKDALTTADQAAARTAFVDAMTRNPAVELHGPLRWIGRWFAPRQLDALSVTEFAERLVDTEPGAAIWLRPPHRARLVVDDLGRRFQRLETGATTYFAQRAKMISIVLALLVAFALNVDAIRLFSVFLTDQQLDAHMLARAQAIKDAYDAQRAATGAPPPAAAGQTQPAAAATAQQNLEEEWRRLQQQIDESTALGLPIGSRYFPWCMGDSPDRACTADNKDRLKRALWCAWTGLTGHPAADRGPCLPQDGRYRVQLLTWLVSVGLAGVLIGLGGPFWFDAFAKLSQAVQILRGLGIATAEPAKGGGAPPPAAGTPASSTPGEAFVTAAATRTRSSGERTLLTPSGLPL
jgi:hypothetical protein